MATGILHKGGQPIHQGPNPLVYGGLERQEHQGADHAIVHPTVLFEEADGATIRMWTGPGTLRHGGYNWDNVPYTLFDVGNIQSVNGLDDRNRLGVQLVVPLTASRALGGQDNTGRVDVTVQPVYSADSGTTWHWVEQAIRGVMSEAEIVPAAGINAKIFRFEVSTLDSDVDRGFIQYYTSENQARRGYPADRFFDHVTTLAQGRRTERWPIFVT